MFQSTPLREGRQIKMINALAMAMVSIHAPARGATILIFAIFAYFIGFNPRPCARGDTETAVLRLKNALFQSTPLREGRLCSPWNNTGLDKFQSTPLREGRRRAQGYDRCVRCFNPRPCARGDKKSISCPSKEHGFNPRPCARGDVRSRGLWSGSTFQSTPLREGRLPLSPAERLCEPVSIHAPARGATSERGLIRAFYKVSIHAPARGATPYYRRNENSFVFQSTPLREGRRAGWVFFPWPCLFQSTPLREGRRL